MWTIEGIAEAIASGARAVVGFEANGGVLLGSDIERAGRVLAALPTRDAMLPILCSLGGIVERGEPLSRIAADFRFKAAASNRLQEVPSARSAAFLGRLEQEPAFRDSLLADLGGVAEMSARDGVRLTARNGEVVHFRASGNAPELRVYVEAEDPARAEALLAWGLKEAGKQA